MHVRPVIYGTLSTADLKKNNNPETHQLPHYNITLQNAYRPWRSKYICIGGNRTESQRLLHLLVAIKTT